MWFAFKLYFIDLWNTRPNNIVIRCPVVICFQIVFYRSLKHRRSHSNRRHLCCDLLSNCILSIFETPFTTEFTNLQLLWFAFKLYFIDLWNTHWLNIEFTSGVVICFQIVFYRSLKHRQCSKFLIDCDLDWKQDKKNGGVGCLE